MSPALITSERRKNTSCRRRCGRQARETIGSPRRCTARVRREVGLGRQHAEGRGGTAACAAERGQHVLVGDDRRPGRLIGQQEPGAGRTPPSGRPDRARASLPPV